MTWTSVGYNGSCTDYHVSLVTGQLQVKRDSICIIHWTVQYRVIIRKHIQILEMAQV